MRQRSKDAPRFSPGIHFRKTQAYFFIDDSEFGSVSFCKRFTEILLECFKCFRFVLFEITTKRLEGASTVFEGLGGAGAVEGSHCVNASLEHFFRCKGS